MLSASLAVLYLLCVAVVRSQPAGTFINPSPQDSTLQDASAAGDAVYTVGNPLNITWVPLATGTMTITMWQADPKDLTTQIGDLQYLSGSRNIDSSYYNWNPIGVDGNNGNPTFNLSASNIFFFDLYQQGGTSPLSVTSFFNLTDSKINPVGKPISSASTTQSTSTAVTSSAITSAATTASSSPSTTSASMSSAAASTSPASATPSPSGLTTGAKIGIGLGVGLGVPILVALLAGIFLLMKKKKKNAASVPLEKDATPAAAGLSAGPPEYKHEMPSPEPHSTNTYGELPAQPTWQQQTPYEMPSDQYR